MKRTLIAVAGSLLAAGIVWAQPFGMGAGMINGYGPAYGMGPGMMAGPGGYAMGPGMMSEVAEAYAGLDLSADQRRQIAEIQQATARAEWQLMGTMREQGYRMHGAVGPGPIDETAARKAFEAMSETRKAMFDVQLDARRKIDAVLTAEQRERLRRYWTSR